MFFFDRSENGELVCIATDESYFILKYDADSVTRARETKEDITEDGVETAFDVSGLFSVVIESLEFLIISNCLSVSVDGKLLSLK